jgi:hypothetical protein
MLGFSGALINAKWFAIDLDSKTAAGGASVLASREFSPTPGYRRAAEASKGRSDRELREKPG